MCVCKIFKPFKINFRKVFLFADEIGKRHSNHTSLAIVDRVIRTCRKWFAINGFPNNVFHTHTHTHSYTK